MHIKHIILDGFKSYRDRTDVGPFDPHFNAITGLNGSGKSNILDSICFVLGLSSLSTVRATTLSDLIYKGAGVSRASVSIVFDNMAKGSGKCPIGYEKYDEIIVSRTVEHGAICKYYLNSLLSTKKKIADMFESVQLNINFPNFMIMQGKITKVVNMKPKEILHMIEETVGASAYQSKRDQTQKQVELKERMMTTMQSTMKEIILPAFLKQQKAAEDVMAFNILCRKRDDINAEYNIVAYLQFNALLKDSKKKLDEVLVADSADEREMQDCKNKIADYNKRQSLMQEEDADKFKGKIAEAEKALGLCKKKKLSMSATVDSMVLSKTDAEKKLEQATNAHKEEMKLMEQWKLRSSTRISDFDAVKAEISTAEDHLQKAVKQENSLKLGEVLNDDGTSFNARDQLIHIERDIMKLTTDFEAGCRAQNEEKIKVKTLKGKLEKAPSETELEKDYKLKYNKVQAMKVEAERRNKNGNETPEMLRASIDAENVRLQRATSEREKITRKTPNLSFYYKPHPSIRKESIHGCVYDVLKLTQLDEWGKAFEKISGSILSQVVVDNEQTAKYLIQPDVLPRRTTIHPLNKFEYKCSTNLTQEQLDRHVGAGNAIKATDLIECDKKYNQLRDRFFGGKVFCKNLNIAKKVAFEMGHYAVTCDGDVADPEGVMQGGVSMSTGNYVKLSQQIRELNELIKKTTTEVDVLKSRVHGCETNAEFMKNYSVAVRELEHSTRVKNLTEFAEMAADLKTLQERMAERAKQLDTWRVELNDLESKKTELQTTVDKLEALRADQIKENHKNISHWRKALTLAQKKFEAISKEVDIDIKSHEALIAECQKEIDAAVNEVEEFSVLVKQNSVELRSIEKEYDVQKKLYDAAVTEKHQWNSEFNKLEDEIRSLGKAIHESELNKMKRNNTRTELTKTVERLNSKLEDLVASNPDFNFKQHEGRELSRKTAAELQDQISFMANKIEEMKTRLDTEGASLLDQTRNQIGSAEQRINQVDTNRDNLIHAIGQLDYHKMKMVSDAYSRVNEEFDKMMTTLLPDSHAKLVPVVPDDLSSGLTIHVCLGGVWKESLTELSGGQRSLVALALVLSLCMYCPAPFYILDEIDAALDLNHTQNIGCLIREKFKDTQFICVSLKDGMYTNANILFQTMFGNGKSTVRRCVRRRTSALPADDTPIVQKNLASSSNELPSGRIKLTAKKTPKGRKQRGRKNSSSEDTSIGNRSDDDLSDDGLGDDGSGKDLLGDNGSNKGRSRVKK